MYSIICNTNHVSTCQMHILTMPKQTPGAQNGGWGCQSLPQKPDHFCDGLPFDSSMSNCLAQIRGYKIVHPCNITTLPNAPSQEEQTTFIFAITITSAKVTNFHNFFFTLKFRKDMWRKFKLKIPPPLKSAQFNSYFSLRQCSNRFECRWYFRFLCRSFMNLTMTKLRKLVHFC